MGGANFLKGAVIGLGDEGVQEFVVDQIRAGKLFAVSGQFVHEGRGGVHTKVFRRLDLQFEIDEQLHVFIEALCRDDTVAVVLLKNVREVFCGHGLTGNVQDGLGLNVSCGCAGNNS